MKFSRTEHEKWMKTHVMRAASAGLLLENEQGKVLVLKANYKAYWTFPGGWIDKDETPKAAALRETLEETGLMISPDDVEFYVVIDRISDIAQTYQFIFRATLEPGLVDHIILQTDEIDEWTLVDKQQVLSGDRQYGEAVRHWAGDSPVRYVEQSFDMSSYGKDVSNETLKDTSVLDN